MDAQTQPNTAEFLPINRAEMLQRGWDEVDFVLVTGDAYVDHPSFGAAIISRVLESEGYRVGVLAQPDFTTCESMREFGRPRFGFFIGGGNVDSMVAHYTVAKRRRTRDEYTPGGVVGKRPDRCATVYTQLAKQAYPDLPVILGGLEASLRRFAHYDYWQDEVLPSIVETSGADLVSFGMGEHQTMEIARRLAAGEHAGTITDVAGTCYVTDHAHLPASYAECASFARVREDKTAYAKACRIQMDNQDPVAGKILVQKQTERYLVQNLPAMPLTRRELDAVYALPYTRRVHPSYAALGGVPAIQEVEFSIIHNRGCFGGCNFCAIQLHQGRRVTSRSADSVLHEAELLTKQPGFKGYIHDVGGPTANFRRPSCGQQMKNGMCTGGKHCLAPQPCGRLIVDHSEYLDILRRMRALPKVKKVFIRSGIRYDYLVRDKDEQFFRELVEHHVSGQLKVAPEHCAPDTLRHMGKPPIEVYDRFAKRFYELTKQAGKQQYLVPYLMSSHPGSTLRDAALLAEYLYKNRIRPEQVQDFYPTPGTVSTCMFYTGLDPYTLKPVYVARTPGEKAMQRALLQYYLPENTPRVRKALQLAHREDLIPLLCGTRAKDRPHGMENGIGKGTEPNHTANAGRRNVKQNTKPNTKPNANKNDKRGRGTWQQVQTGTRETANRKNKRRR
ncbi:MAG: YgiQ family radical SAM protein [Subdoligranulum sp.]|nr:YgiQ family radical SAM protein [Subdoligranulum sp.]